MCYYTPKDAAAANGERSAQDVIYVNSILQVVHCCPRITPEDAKGHRSRVRSTGVPASTWQRSTTNAPTAEDNNGGKSSVHLL